MKSTTWWRGQKPRRPVMVSSAGSSVSPAVKRDGHPDRRDGAERVRAADGGDEQHEHGQRDGQAAGEDRRAGAPDRELHRLVLVLVPAQLLAVARDQQQAVVRPHPEHQHHEDRRAVVGDRRPRLGVQVDEPARDRVREPHHHERDQRDHRRAVDQEQQHDDERDGDQEDLGVEVAEDLLEVGVEAEPAGDVDLEPVRRVLVRPHRGGRYPTPRAGRCRRARRRSCTRGRRPATRARAARSPRRGSRPVPGAGSPRRRARRRPRSRRGRRR